MSLGDVTGDGQAQAGAAGAGVSGVVESSEPVEDRRGLVSGDAGPVVRDGDDRPIAVAPATPGTSTGLRP